MQKLLLFDTSQLILQVLALIIKYSWAKDGIKGLSFQLMQQMWFCLGLPWLVCIARLYILNRKAFYLSQKWALERVQQLKSLYEDELQRALQEDGSPSSSYITPKTYYPGS